MRWRNPSTWLLIPWLALACGQATQEPEPSAEPAVPISGLYKVTGKTVTLVNGDTREIAGTVTLNETEAGYTATFSLNTTAPGADQAMPAEVIGIGQGQIEGRTLTGTAETQLVMSTVPGIDPGFAFIPRSVSTRITSTSTATVANDGSVTIKIENEGIAGHEYLQTRTSLRGRRIADAAIGGPEPPNVPAVAFDDLEDYDPSDYVDEELPEDDEE
ncbi:MAG: hypothetical protein JRH16_02240 [Deltaproteobacteria bacterium]|nr:hypothetical protein [Deltaproteobacteria bacterium]MBW2360552.1 hypothetical protein [Deltaproteobacteria bacterium]